MLSVTNGCARFKIEMGQALIMMQALHNDDVSLDEVRCVLRGRVTEKAWAIERAAACVLQRSDRNAK